MTRTAEPRDAIRGDFAWASEHFEVARSSGAPLVEQTYSIAGRVVRLRVVGARLAEELGRPWRHLEAPSARREEDLRVDLWHGRETGIGPPPRLASLDPFDRFPFAVSRDDRFVAHRQCTTFSVLDRRTRRLVGIVEDVGARSLYELGRPLEAQILFWLRDRAVPVAHAAGVVHAGGAALVLGLSGSGKSTLTAACLERGWGFLNDDKVAFERLPGGDFVAYSLNASLHLDEEALTRVPTLAVHAEPPQHPADDKHRVPIDRLLPASLRAEAPLRALFLPKIGRSRGEEPRRVSAAEALRALSLGTLLALPHAGQRSLDALAEVAADVPAWTVTLSEDAEDAPSRMAEILATAGRPGAVV